jgi:cysteine desulfurase/selenocysteine lyase
VAVCRCATEVINLVSRVFEHGRFGRWGEVLITECEHRSDILPWLFACREIAAKLLTISMMVGGIPTLPRLAAILDDHVKIVLPRVCQTSLAQSLQ